MFSPVTEQGKVFFFQIKRKEKVKYSTPLCIRQSAKLLNLRSQQQSDSHQCLNEKCRPLL